MERYEYFHSLMSVDGGWRLKFKVVTEMQDCWDVLSMWKCRSARGGIGVGGRYEYFYFVEISRLEVGALIVLQMQECRSFWGCGIVGMTENLGRRRWIGKK